MKKKIKLKLILIAVFFVGIAGAGFCFLSLSQINAYSSIRDPGGIPQGLPVRLKIPVIGVNVAIEDALITPDGRMDVPAGAANVAWYALGPQPGQVGALSSADIMVLTITCHLFFIN